MFVGLSADLDRIRKLVQAAKEGDTAAIDVLAAHLAGHPSLRGFQGIVVPVPRSTPDRPSLLPLAQALVDHGVGRKAEVLVERVQAIPSSREARAKGRTPPTAAEHRDTLRVVRLATRAVPVLLVDDVVTTGTILCAAAEALRAAGWNVVGATATGWTASPAKGFDPATAWNFRNF